jgi:hypothetical protein
MSLGGIMHRSKPVARKLDYFVIIKRLQRHRRSRQALWTWEIRRPLAAKFNGDECVTPQVAKLAGEKALAEFLHKVSQRQGATRS